MMSEIPSSSQEKLHFPLLLGLVIGNMIGSGIYILPTTLAAYGSISLFSWLLTSLGALCLAFVFARLNHRFPSSGGPYVYVREAFGSFMGFVIAYTYWIGLWVTNAAIVVSAVNYLGLLFPSLNDQAVSYDPLLSLGVKIGFVWLFTVINLWGIRVAGLFELGLTVVKMAPLVLISIVAIFKMKFHHFFPINVSGESHPMAILNAAAICLWAFMGLETATIPAEEASSTRAIYKATVYGTLIAAVVYIFCTLALMGLIPASELKHSAFPFSDAARLLFGERMAQLTSICAVVAALGALNVSILLQGQIPLAAARDGFFPAILARQNSKRAPVWGLVISSVFITCLLLLTWKEKLIHQFMMISLLAIFASLLTYGMTSLAELKFLIQENRLRFNRLAFVSAILAAVYSLWMVWGVGSHAVYCGLWFLLSAVPVYFILKKSLTW